MGRVTLTVFHPSNQLQWGNLPQPENDHLAIFNTLEVQSLALLQN